MHKKELYGAIAEAIYDQLHNHLFWAPWTWNWAVRTRNWPAITFFNTSLQTETEQPLTEWVLKGNKQRQITRLCSFQVRTENAPVHELVTLHVFVFTRKHSGNLAKTANKVSLSNSVFVRVEMELHCNVNDSNFSMRRPQVLPPQLSL
jgi:hypothetical protein